MKLYLKGRKYVGLEDNKKSGVLVGVRSDKSVNVEVLAVCKECPEDEKFVWVDSLLESYCSCPRCGAEVELFTGSIAKARRACHDFLYGCKLFSFNYLTLSDY